MITSKISITECVPAFTYESYNDTLDRIAKLFPVLSDESWWQLFYDLFSLSDTDRETFEENIYISAPYNELEPALSSQELRVMAERIIGYCNNDIDDAIYHVRNILNCIPKSVDDLYDYVPKFEVDDFEERLRSALSIHGMAQVSLSEPDKLKEMVPTVLIEAFCNEEMERFQSKPLSANPGITERQKMLNVAGKYYLNHLVGFQCNSAWLASFLEYSDFGCPQGWIHKDGSLCEGRHFGFKDEKSVPKLVDAGFQYIKTILHNSDANARIHQQDEIDHTASMYIDTLISTMDILLRDYFQNRESPEDKICQQYHIISDLIEEHIHLLSDLQYILYKTTSHVYKGVPLCREDLKRYADMVECQQGKPNQRFLHLFDAWNFLIIGVNQFDTTMLFELFIRGRYEDDKLYDFSQFLLGSLSNEALPENAEDLFKGFFENFLYQAVNANSDTHFLYDVIFASALQAVQFGLETDDTLMLMAKLGYDRAMEYAVDLSVGPEKAYWASRRALISSKVTNNG